MTRRNRGFGLRALIVESIGAMFVLYLLFPEAGAPPATAPQHPRPDASQVGAVQATRPLPVLSIPGPAQTSRGLSVLQLPAPPEQRRTVSTTFVNDQVAPGAERARREFVAQELDYSRRTLVALVKRHLQSIVTSPPGRE